MTTPQPLLTSVAPVAVQVGVPTEFTVTGTDLDGATRLHFSIAGVDCKPVLDAKQKPVPNKFNVTIPAGAQCGPCDVRAAAHYGISNPRGVGITTLPVVALPATATTAEKALKVPLNSVITGTSVKQGSGFIAFQATKGQHVLAVCRPAWLDSRMDAGVTLLSEEGATLERMQTDGVLDFTAASNGTYVMRISDLMYRGDADCPFALALTTETLVEYAFDGGTTWTLFGRGLPKGAEVLRRFGKPLERVQMAAEEARPLLTKDFIKPLRFGAESESPSAATTKPVELKTPATFTGWFAERGKARYFTFEAHKGDVLWIEVNCASHGVVADPYLILEKVAKDTSTFIAESNDRPAIAAKDEFDAGWADPSYRFEVKEDGAYRIKLRNLYSSAPREPFELTVKPAGADADLVAIPTALPKAKTIITVDINAAPLWRGGAATLKVFALRHSGFKDAIELNADGLPGGVQFAGGLIREGQSIGFATFTADETAKEWAGPVSLHAKGGKNAISANVVFKVTSTAKEPVVTRFADEVVLGVVDAEAPVLVQAVNPVFETAVGTKVSIPLQIKRRGDCTEAFKLTALGLNDAVVDVDVAAKASASKLDLDLAKLKLPAGDYQVVLQGSVKFKHKRSEDPKAAAKDVVFLVNSLPVSLHIQPSAKK